MWTARRQGAACRAALVNARHGARPSPLSPESELPSCCLQSRRCYVAYNEVGMAAHLAVEEFVARHWSQIAGHLWRWCHAKLAPLGQLNTNPLHLLVQHRSCPVMLPAEWPQPGTNLL